MTESIHDTLLDRMPEVAGGHAGWSPTEVAHLASCADCAAAWRIVQGTARLGRTIEQGFDVSRAADGVLLRLRSRAASSWGVRRVAMGIAAAAAVVVLAVGLRGPAPATVPASRALPTGVRFLPELDSLSTDELTTVAEEVDRPTSELEATDGQQLFELDSTQLERVLRSLEG